MLSLTFEHLINLIIVAGSIAIITAGIWSKRRITRNARAAVARKEAIAAIQRIVVERAEAGQARAKRTLTIEEEGKLLCARIEFEINRERAEK